VFDVAMDADRAAVHHTSDTGARRGLDHGRHRPGIHCAVLVLAKSGLTVDRGDVVDDLDALGRAFDRARLTNVAGGDGDAVRCQCARPSVIAHERNHVLTARGQRTGEMAAGETGRAGD
jgi:hypothetical protein